MPQVEEREKVRYTRSVSSLEGSEEESKSHHTGPILCCRLEDGDCTKAEDDNGGPDMWWDNLPHQREPLEDYIADVEYCEQPLIFVTREVEILLHARDLGVPMQALAKYDKKHGLKPSFSGSLVLTQCSNDPDTTSSLEIFSSFIIKVVSRIHT